jgi:7-carboxy-7-deazaguanine synthase
MASQHSEVAEIKRTSDINDSVQRMAHLRVSELFTSIQGEGLDIGQPFSFIRLFGCNYYCTWCDTKYAVQHWSDTYEEKTPLELADWAKKQANTAVCLTGGEPLTAPANLFLDLVHQLKANGHYLDIQTNGTIYRSSLSRLIDSWSISPKLGSSGMLERPDILRRYIQAYIEGTLTGRILFKFVIAHQQDLDLTYELLSILPEIHENKIPIILQPEGQNHSNITDYLARLRWLVETVALGPLASQWQEYTMHILPQLHRMIWESKRGI